MITGIIQIQLIYIYLLIQIQLIYCGILMNILFIIGAGDIYLAILN